MKLERKRRNNMYGFVEATRNPVAGKCPFTCKYCYAKRYHHFEPGVFSFDEATLANLGNHRTIFLGSRIDLWNDLIPAEILSRILWNCRKFQNEYLFQSKNPQRFVEFLSEFPENSILCTTIETNREDLILSISNAPPVHLRVKAMKELDWRWKMVTIEPILQFDISELIEMVNCINPNYVNVGADSKNHHLQEPTGGQVDILIKLLKEMPRYVIEKSNLERLRVIDD